MPDLKKICRNKLQLKIISFFHQHQSLVDTAHGISAWLNHDRQEVEKALNYLVSQKVLTLHRTGSTKAYAYTQERQITDKIEGVLEKGARDV